MSSRARVALSPAPHAPVPELANLAAVHVALLNWFAADGRDHPWRRTRDPWRILVSEIMLQQIQVSRAIPFYSAFVARFPTVDDLAAASLADAIRVWGTLGRYRRVVALHRTAQIVVATHDGRIPRDPAVLRTLPGIGPYTAGAVACFAYEDDTAFLDTNMRRVLHRLFVGPDVPSRTVNDAALRRLAEAAVPAGRGWFWNQALMDFGAVRCTALRPACNGCPLRAHCRAFPGVLHALTDIKAARRAKRHETGSIAANEPAHAADPALSSRRPALPGHRYYRGRVLEQLCALPDEDQAAIELRRLGSKVLPDFTDADEPWLRGVVQSLAHDGLAVAEERPAYDASGDGDLVIRLPGD